MIKTKLSQIALVIFIVISWIGYAKLTKNYNNTAKTEQNIEKYMDS